METTTIKITQATKTQLDNLKFEKEAYNTIIQRLIKENEELKADKDHLLKIAVNSTSVNTFPEVKRTSKFTVLSILSDDGLNDNEKLNCLRIFLKPDLETNTSEVLTGISEIESNFNFTSNVLGELKTWISENYQ